MKSVLTSVDFSYWAITRSVVFYGIANQYRKHLSEKNVVYLASLASVPVAVLASLFSSVTFSPESLSYPCWRTCLYLLLSCWQSVCFERIPILHNHAWHHSETLLNDLRRLWSLGSCLGLKLHARSALHMFFPMSLFAYSNPGVCFKWHLWNTWILDLPLVQNKGMQEELVIGQGKERCSNFSPMKMFQKGIVLWKDALFTECAGYFFSLSTWVTTKEVNRDAISWSKWPKHRNLLWRLHHYLKVSSSLGKSE